MPNIIMADKTGEELIIKRITNTLESYVVPDTVARIADGAFARCSSLKTITFPQSIIIDGVSSGTGCFIGSGLERVHLHSATINGYNNFRQCASLKTFVGENITIGTSRYYTLYGCGHLEAFDATINDIIGDTFQYCSKLATLILRNTNTLPTCHASTFNLTPFMNGGTGGTIYIPKDLYDHLGDGTSLDYKAASGWSTVDGYGTITWAKIEGSIYETHYADGTPIPSA